MKLKIIISAFISVSSVLSVSSLYAAATENQEVNVYSGRKAKLIKPALDDFTAKTGIKVNLLTAKADALMQRLLTEGKNSPADILITADVGRLSRAKQAGLFQSIDSAALREAIPSTYRDTEGQWFGLSLRARPIFYAKGKVLPEELSSYQDLANEKWRGRICIRSSNNIYNQSLVASMINAQGEAITQEFLNAFVKNFARKPAGGDTDQLRALAAGVCDVAIANTYYFGRLINQPKNKDLGVAEKMGLFWPNQANKGVHVNVSGAGVVNNAPNPKAAQKLIEFLSQTDTQAWYAQVNNEFPIAKDAPISETLTSWGEFKADDIALSKLGELNTKAVMLMDKAGWR